ncbi:MAG: DoxX family protein, partial [Nitrospinales bacterium]
MITIASIIYGIKAVVTGAIFFVWVVRYQNIVEEFKVYRLPPWLRDLVGVLKLSFAFMLHIPDPTTVLFGSSGISFLMVAALVTHLRIKNP